MTRDELIEVLGLTNVKLIEQMFNEEREPMYEEAWHKLSKYSQGRLYPEEFEETLRNLELTQEGKNYLFLIIDDILE